MSSFIMPTRLTSKKLLNRGSGVCKINDHTPNSHLYVVGPPFPPDTMLKNLKCKSQCEKNDHPCTGATVRDIFSIVFGGKGPTKN